MNVNLNNIQQTSISTMPAEVAPSAQTQKAGQSAALSITNAAASPEEVAGAEISEASLDRDDPLGQLVNKAFDLPPPPFPSLPTD